MSSNSRLYDKIVLPQAPSNGTTAQKMYKGFSTINPDTGNFNLYDLELVKQDIINHFHVRQGERLMQPMFGTIIWDLLFEPLTDELKDLVLQNVNTIIGYDPRVTATRVSVSSYASGIQIECSLTFLPYNISQSLRLRFDQEAGLLIQ